MTAPPAEPVRCRATKGDGRPCGVSWGLAPDTQLCLVHDPERKAAADAARAAGGTTTAAGAAAKRASKFRTLDPAQLGGRPARTLADIERGVALVTFSVVTGAVDPATAREYFRGSQTHKEIKKLRGLVADVVELRRAVKQLKRARSA